LENATTKGQVVESKSAGIRQRSNDPRSRKTIRIIMFLKSWRKELVFRIWMRVMSSVSSAR